MEGNVMKQELHLPGQTYLVCLKNTRCGEGFYDAACYEFYLKRLHHSLNQFQVKLHAYCFLANEIYLLLTPSTPLGLTHLLDSLNSQYAGYYNLRFERQTRKCHWRSTSSLIHGDVLALDCQKFIETLPKNLGLVNHPGTHHWSSYCSNAFCMKSTWLTPHNGYRVFLQNKAHSLGAYRDYLDVQFAVGYVSYLTHKLQLGMPPGHSSKNLPASPEPGRRAFSNYLH
jgi:REP element-mobilizing transposase RayT